MTWGMAIPATAILPDERVTIVLTATEPCRLRKLTLSRSAAGLIVVVSLRLGASITEARELISGMTPAEAFGKEQPDTLDEPVSCGDVLCLEMRNVSDRRTVVAGVLLGDAASNGEA